MEVVGIGYTLWFTNRYLLLKVKLVKVYCFTQLISLGSMAVNVSIGFAEKQGGVSVKNQRDQEASVGFRSQLSPVLRRVKMKGAPCLSAIRFL